jgi:hypothetical protein
MLEHRILLLRPRPLVPRVRDILDGDSGATLGYARLEIEASSWWPRLFGRGVLAVHEQEDEPLLLTIRRAWKLSARRHVYDAEGQPIGDLLGRLIHDRYRRPLAALEHGVFRAPDRRALAELAATEEGLRLTFHDDIAGEPFVKMLLLAAALQK